MAQWSTQYRELTTSRYSALVSYAALLTGDRDSAQDLTQDALVRTFGKPRLFPSAGHAEAYAKRAIVSLFIDGKRRRSTLMRAFARVAERGISRDESGPVEARDAVEAGLAALPRHIRACVVLRFYDDLTVAEVANQLGIAHGTAKRYLSDGIAALRSSIGPGEVTVERDASQITVRTTQPRKADS